MTFIESITLEAPDPTAVSAFYTDAFGLGTLVQVRPSETLSAGFRGFTMSLLVPRPKTVDHFVGAALDCGATTLKAAAKSFWGYGGVVRAPDGAIWQVATSSSKDTGPATRQIDDVVLLLGVADVKASKRFYVEHGLEVARSFGSKYVEFTKPASGVQLALYGRRALAKVAGVSAEGSGSHHMVIAGAVDAFTDPDGFAWEPASTLARLSDPSGTIK